MPEHMSQVAVVRSAESPTFRVAKRSSAGGHRILYVWDADYPWDVRTEKMSAALTAAGYSVRIAARNVARQPLNEDRPEASIGRMPVLPIGGHRINAATSFPAFFNPRWVRHIAREATRHHADMIIVRDLPLAPTAAVVGAWLELPVVLDMAENYPEMMRDIWTSGRARWSDAFVRNPAVVSLVERATLPHIDHIITVVQESADRLEALGVPRDRLSVVSNTPSASRIRRRADAVVGRLRVVYLGLLEQPRGVQDLLCAVAALREEGIDLQLDIVGDGRDADRLHALATSLSLPPTDVIFHGRLAHSAALKVVSTADVGIVPHHAFESWNTTIPNKLFDYMAAGLAVITSDARPAARIVKRTAAGLVFRSGDAQSLADAIRMLTNATTRRRFAEAGQLAVSTTYNWERDSQVLLDVVDALIAKRKLSAATR